MSRTLKWILGILAVLAVVGVIVGGIFLWRNHSSWWGPQTFSYRVPAPPNSQAGPLMHYGFERYPRHHMYGWGGGMPMHGYGGGYGISGFGGHFFRIAGLFRMIVSLAILALVAYVFYQMGRRAGAAQASTDFGGAPREIKPLPGRKVASR